MQCFVFFHLVFDIYMKLIDDSVPSMVLSASIRYNPGTSKRSVNGFFWHLRVNIRGQKGQNNPNPIQNRVTLCTSRSSVSPSVVSHWGAIFLREQVLQDKQMEKVATALIVVPVAGLLRLGRPCNGVSCWSLQCIQKVAIFEDHLKVTTSPECNGPNAGWHMLATALHFWSDNGSLFSSWCNYKEIYSFIQH